MKVYIKKYITKLVLLYVDLYACVMIKYFCYVYEVFA